MLCVLLPTKCILFFLVLSRDFFFIFLFCLACLDFIHSFTYQLVRVVFHAKHGEGDYIFYSTALLKGLVLCRSVIHSLNVGELTIRRSASPFVPLHLLAARLFCDGFLTFFLWIWSTCSVLPKSCFLFFFCYILCFLSSFLWCSLTSVVVQLFTFILSPVSQIIVTSLFIFCVT